MRLWASQDRRVQVLFETMCTVAMGNTQWLRSSRGRPLRGRTCTFLRDLATQKPEYGGPSLPSRGMGASESSMVSSNCWASGVHTEQKPSIPPPVHPGTQTAHSSLPMRSAPPITARHLPEATPTTVLGASPVAYFGLYS